MSEQVTVSVTVGKGKSEPLRSFSCEAFPVIVTGMVTRIHKGFKGRLFLREHREALGIDATRMADRMNVERESLYRLERNAHKIDWGKAVQYAHALGIAPARLLRPPGTVSLDELVAGHPLELQEMAADIITRLVAKK